MLFSPIDIIYVNFFFFLLLFFIVLQVQLSPFLPPYPPGPSIPTSHPLSYPLWLCPCAVYTCSLRALPLFSPIISLPSTLWLLSDCSLFQCLWLYFVCLFVLLISLHLQVRSHGCLLYTSDAADDWLVV